SLEGSFNNPSKNGTGGPLGQAINSDILQYTSPELVKGLTVTALRFDNIGAPAASTTRGTTANALGVNYTDGPISAGADYTIFNKTSATNTAKEATRIRVSGSYDLGVAVIGAGYEDNNDMGNSTVGTTTTTAAARNAANYTLGAKVPLGAFTLGAVFAKSEAKRAQATTFATKAYGLAAQYDFSKRTNVNYTFLKQSDSAVATYEGNRHQLRLMHSF
ncbi:MAG: porin, partial [Chitinophagia bacterium]|nr:porin [Chitinophagia bacterium]